MLGILLQSGHSGRLTQQLQVVFPGNASAYICSYDSWVDAKGKQPFGAQLGGQGSSHEHVGRLGLAIGSPLVVSLAALTWKLAGRKAATAETPTSKL